MGHEPVGQRFRDEVAAFLAVTGMKRSEFGREVNGNRSFVTWLLDGGLPRLATMDKAHAADGRAYDAGAARGDPGGGRGRGDRRFRSGKKTMRRSRWPRTAT